VKYRIVLEYDPSTGHHTATVPGLPGLFVDAKTERGALKLAKEGIAFYLEQLSAGRRSGSRKRNGLLPTKIVTVDV